MKKTKAYKGKQLDKFTAIVGDRKRPQTQAFGQRESRASCPPSSRLGPERPSILESPPSLVLQKVTLGQSEYKVYTIKY